MYIKLWQASSRSTAARFHTLPLEFDQRMDGRTDRLPLIELLIRDYSPHNYKPNKKQREVVQLQAKYSLAWVRGRTSVPSLTSPCGQLDGMKTLSNLPASINRFSPFSNRVQLPEMVVTINYGCEMRGVVRPFTAVELWWPLMEWLTNKKNLSKSKRFVTLGSNVVSDYSSQRSSFSSAANGVCRCPRPPLPPAMENPWSDGIYRRF